MNDKIFYTIEAMLSICMGLFNILVPPIARHYDIFGGMWIMVGLFCIYKLITIKE